MVSYISHHYTQSHTQKPSTRTTLGLIPNCCFTVYPIGIAYSFDLCSSSLSSPVSTVSFNKGFRVLDFCSLPTDPAVFCAGTKMGLQLWDTRTHRVRPILPTTAAWTTHNAVVSVQCCPVTPTVYAAKSTGNIEVWDLRLMKTTTATHCIDMYSAFDSNNSNESSALGLYSTTGALTCCALNPLHSTQLAFQTLNGSIGWIDLMTGQHHVIAHKIHHYTLHDLSYLAKRCCSFMSPHSYSTLSSLVEKSPTTSSLLAFANTDQIVRVSHIPSNKHWIAAEDSVDALDASPENSDELLPTRESTAPAASIDDDLLPDAADTVVQADILDYVITTEAVSMADSSSLRSVSVFPSRIQPTELSAVPLSFSIMCLLSHPVHNCVVCGTANNDIVVVGVRPPSTQLGD